MGQKLIDEMGHHYGSLEVIGKAQKYGKAAWLCKCECGNTTIVKGGDLRSGRRTTCGFGCPTKFGKGNFQDLTDQTFGRLQAKYRNGSNSSGKVLWHCICECGNEVDVVSQALTNGTTQSCGCLQRELASQRHIKNILGQEFGKLKVIEYRGIKNTNAMWLCECKCGRQHEVAGSCLTSGNTRSCGCVQSWKEVEISNFLDKQKIQYVQQYTYDDLRSKNMVMLRFDFALLYNNRVIGLIEYQGEQHYNPKVAWYSEDLIERDNRKREYCKEHNIPLLYLAKDSDIEGEILKFYENNH